MFGPVLSVIPYRDEDEAVAIANGTPYGLAGSVWSGDRSGGDGGRAAAGGRARST